MFESQDTKEGVGSGVGIDVTATSRARRWRFAGDAAVDSGAGVDTTAAVCRGAAVLLAWFREAPMPVKSSATSSHFRPFLTPRERRPRARTVAEAGSLV